MDFLQQQLSYKKMCEQAIQQAAARCFQPDDVSEVSKAARYALFNGGKRVRGVLVLAVCELLGGSLEKAMPFAAAVEMVHAYSLVHDDLPCMDNADTRRGAPSAHVAFGEATALLAGDLLLTEAFNELSKAELPPEWIVKGISSLATAAGAKGMIFGQELDLKNETQPAGLEQVFETHKNKTGALLSAAAMLGLLASESQRNQHFAVLEYASRLGLVFQIVDDVLDATSTEEIMGKPVQSDAENNKTTFVNLLGLEKCHEEVTALTEEATMILHSEYGEKADFLCWFAAELAKRVQ